MNLPYSPEAFLASHSVTLDEEKERQMTATSGQKCLQSLRTSDQTGSSLRMFEDSLLGTTAWFSKQCALTWKAKVTKSGRTLFQLAAKVRPTDENESGLLPTARAQEPSRTSLGYGDCLNDIVKGNKDKNIPPIGNETGEKLRLQPAMTEWMMGFPEGWTELPIETNPPTALVPRNTAKTG